VKGRRDHPGHSTPCESPPADLELHGLHDLRHTLATWLEDAGMGVGERGVADRPCRWRPRPPGVAAGLRDLQHSAADLYGESVGGHHLDRREPLKEGVASSAARWPDE
jgi:hypothetical protein